MIARLEDWLLAKLQRDCKHPDKMVAVDILEGSGSGIEVGYCRRCGAVRLSFQQGLPLEWRLPDPHLWQG